MCRLGVKCYCEQPDNINTCNSKPSITSSRVVALFTGGRSSATATAKTAGRGSLKGAGGVTDALSTE